MMKSTRYNVGDIWSAKIPESAEKGFISGTCPVLITSILLHGGIMVMPCTKNIGFEENGFILEINNMKYKALIDQMRFVSTHSIDQYIGSIGVKNINILYDIFDQLTGRTDINSDIYTHQYKVYQNDHRHKKFRYRKVDGTQPNEKVEQVGDEAQPNNMVEIKGDENKKRKKQDVGLAKSNHLPWKTLNLSQQWIFRTSSRCTTVKNPRQPI